MEIDMIDMTTALTPELVDITGLDRISVLRALYKSSKPIGLGQLHFRPGELSNEEARTALSSSRPYVDYLYGRVIKVDFSDEESFDPYLYDRDNGYGCAAKIVNQLREFEGST